MEKLFLEELKRLREMLLHMGFLVQENLEKSIRALVERDEKLAAQVIADEAAINFLEIEIDDKGHALIALGQPLAHDLRFVTMTLKIVTDLERIGDHAVNIAEKASFVLNEKPVSIKLDLNQMARSTLDMFKAALDAFIKEDSAIARDVLASDDIVDSYNRSLYDQLEAVLNSDPSVSRAALNLLMIGHNLERVADLACNIAEDVIYMREGREIRHRFQDHRPLK